MPDELYFIFPEGIVDQGLLFDFEILGGLLNPVLNWGEHPALYYSRNYN